MKKIKEKKYQFCKCIVILTGILFILTLSYCLHLIKNASLDLTLGVTAITTTGAMFSSTVIWYMKKAQAENVIKWRMAYTEAAARIELEVYEKKMRLKKELEIESDPDIDDDSVIEDIYTDAVEDDTNYLISQFEDATSSQESEIHIN